MIQLAKSKECSKQLLGDFSKVTKYKVNTKVSLTFYLTNNKKKIKILKLIVYLKVLHINKYS